MDFDIRVLAPSEVERWKQLQKTAFMAPQEDVDREAALVDPDWVLGAYIDGRLEASTSSIPFGFWLEGAEVPMGGVSGVACMPEYRRQGLVGALLSRILERCREKGEPLSGLWTPHPALYRRYGWELSTDATMLTFNPKHISLEPGPRPDGKIESLSAKDWHAADRIYRVWGGKRNSLLVRDDVFWKQIMLHTRNRASYLYRSASGEPEGYAVINVPVGGRMADRTLSLRELVANTGPAYRALLGLVLNHDLVGNVRWVVAPDEPFLDLVVDPTLVEMTRLTAFGLMLRIIDLSAALAARPAYGEGRIVVAVADRDCSWNAGAWVISAKGGHLQAERSSEAPKLTLGARALAQLYNGFRSATVLARAGRIQVHDASALSVADGLFAMRTTPFCADEF